MTNNYMLFSAMHLYIKYSLFYFYLLIYSVIRAFYWARIKFCQDSVCESSSICNSIEDLISLKFINCSLLKQLIFNNFEGLRHKGNCISTFILYQDKFVEVENYQILIRGNTNQTLMLIIIF